LEKMLLIVEEWCEKTIAEIRIAIEKSPRVFGATRRKVIKREELVEERNRREGKILGLTTKTYKAGASMSDWEGQTNGRNLRA